MITLQISKPWNIVTPVLFRYLNQEFINEFFKSGRLRISSFQAFSKYQDEQRFDPNEGQNILNGLGNGVAFGAKVRFGRSSLVLSTSTIEDDQLLKAFNVDGYFKIKDSTGFGISISNKIPCFVSGTEGPCIYSSERSIQRKIDLKNRDVKGLKELKKKDSNLYKDELSKIINEISEMDGYFLKLNKYSHQNEYRLIWNCEYLKEDAMFIECPKAIQFCEKVT
jgi:hypothetical protein